MLWGVVPLRILILMAFREGSFFRNWESNRQISNQISTYDLESRSEMKWGTYGCATFSLNPSTSFPLLTLHFNHLNSDTPAMWRSFYITYVKIPQALNWILNVFLVQHPPDTWHSATYSGVRRDLLQFFRSAISCRLSRRALFRRLLLNESMKNMWQQCNPSSSWGTALKIMSILTLCLQHL